MTEELYNYRHREGIRSTEKVGPLMAIVIRRRAQSANKQLPVGEVGVSLVVVAYEALEAPHQRRILRLAVLPSIPEAGVDVGGDKDLGSQERNIIPFYLDRDLITIQKLEYI